MKWILVYIYINPFTVGDLSSHQPTAVNAMGPMVTFSDMSKCFMARDALSLKVGEGNGYFGPGKQAICVPVE